MKKIELTSRLQNAIAICESAGQSLMELKISGCLPKKNLKKNGQLKSAVDIAAEFWVVSLLKSFYPKDGIMAEESQEQGKNKLTNKQLFWTVDALDGTRSYYEGFKGFCVQIALIENGKIILGVVHGPALGLTYWALDKGGAFKKLKGKVSAQRIFVKIPIEQSKIYTDSHLASGKIETILKLINIKRFLECGSFGLKICLVAEGKADIFLKKSSFKIWDTSPGELILKEAGGLLTLWDGKSIDYSGKRIFYENLLAAGSEDCHKKILSLIGKNNLTN